MPFSNTSSAASARSRRVKDKDKEKEKEKDKEKEKEKERDTRSVHPATSSRRSRDTPRPSLRASPPNARTSQPSLYSQQNVTLDHLPPLPSSGTASPSSATSPVLKSTQASSGSSSIYQLPTHYRTPASLQPYLEDETSDQETPLASETHFNHPPDPHEVGSNPEDHSLARSTDHSPTRPQGRSPEASPVRSSPPPPLSQSPATVQPHGSPVLYKTVQPTHSPAYLASPQPISPSLHFHRRLPTETFFPSQYPEPHHYAMEQPQGPLTDYPQPSGQPMQYFPGYGSPHAMPMALNPMMSPTGHNLGYPGPRIGGTGEAFSGAAQQAADAGERGSLDGGGGSIQSPEDDAVDLLQRIQSAIPDLHLLLNRYRETSGQLGVRENLIRQTEAQKAEALRQKERHIEHLARELEAISHKHSAESSKLRLEVGNLEEKHKELQDNLVARKVSRDELEAANVDLRRENELMGRRSLEDKEAGARDLAEWKEDVRKGFEDKQKLANDELQRLKNNEAVLEQRISEMRRVHDREKDVLRLGAARERMDMETNHARVRQQLDSALQKLQREVEEAQSKEREGRETWARERDALIHGWEEERTGLGKIWEEQRLGLMAQHNNEKDEMQSNWRASQEQHGRRVEQENEKLRMEVERLKTGWDADKTKFVKATKELKAVATKLDNENSSLQKMIEAFGEATDFKSRGDAFFIDAFNQLRKQISELAGEYCKHMSEQPPEQVIRKIPIEMPGFFSNSQGSYALRAAYIEHIISRIVTQRVFQPFLFTLSRRNDATDELFQTMSQKLRHKSTRRETLWRQHTLHAAYTVSSAKQSINKVAASIVEEIMDEIKYFTSPDQYEQITVAVRRIVKVAAETWRYARLERELITASFSPAQNPAMFRPANAGSSGNGGKFPTSEVLLPLLPFIKREPSHEDLRSSPNQDDRGCVFLYGVALYADSPIVLARKRELQQQGTVQATTGWLTAQSVDEEMVHDRSSDRRSTTIEQQLSALVPSGGVNCIKNEPASRRSQQWSSQSEDQADIPTNHNPGEKENVAALDSREKASVRQTTESERSQTPMSRTSLGTSSERRSSSTPTPPAEAIPNWGSTSDVLTGRNRTK